MGRTPKTDERPVPNRIPVLRAERDLSRRDLAEAIGVHYQTVGYLERGEYNPSLSLAMTICDFFGLPVEAVFSFDEFTPLSEVIYERSSE
ncbi:MAG: helix-turn-helix transcriptional regulator [Actinomycetota bacterium]